jgi:hypothetical protein
MAYNRQVFEHQYPTVNFFVQRLAYYRGLSDAMENLTGHREFWVSTVDGHLKLATTAWCTVFGVYNEDLHWTKTPTGNNVEIAKQDFLDRLLSKTGFTPEQWQTYHKEMLTFRNKYVIHFDLSQKFSAPVPYFDPALQVAYSYQEWVRELISPVLLGQPTLSSLYEQCRAAAFSVINSYIPKG